MTKPVPGAKRGRRWSPKSDVPTKPPRSRGRPSRLPLCQHPRRYDIATAAAFAWILNSDRAGALLSLWYEGKPKSEPDEAAVDSLRKLAAAFNTAEDKSWLSPIAEAIAVSMVVGHDDPDLAIRMVVRRTAKVTDRMVARHVLLPPLFDLRRKRRREKSSLPN